ncbi:hypothetical protein IHE44_0003161, partial [Lamprotornis superbus]
KHTVLGVEEAGKIDITENYFTKYEKEESLPMYLKYVLLTEVMFVKLNKRIHLCFFEHLEKWFAGSLSNSYVFVAAKKEELNSILLLHLKLHQQKQEDMQTNIYNARVHNLEYDLLHTPVTEQSASSSNNLKSELRNHLESVRVTVRSYQQHLEKALGKLRDLNVGFLKSCRLFSEVDDFSSEGVKFFNKCLQKESKQIDSFESSVKTDVVKIKSSFLEQVVNSNLQSVTLKSYLEKLQQKRDPYVHSTAKKELTSNQHEMISEKNLYAEKNRAPPGHALAEAECLSAAQLASCSVHVAHKVSPPGNERVMCSKKR